MEVKDKTKIELIKEFENNYPFIDENDSKIIVENIIEYRYSILKYENII